MSKNKHTRTVVAGLLRNAVRHEEKIREELRKPRPNIDSIKQWEREIDNARKRVRKLEQRLER